MIMISRRRVKSTVNTFIHYGNTALTERVFQPIAHCAVYHIAVYHIAVYHIAVYHTAVYNTAVYHTAVYHMRYPMDTFAQTYY